MERLFDKCLKIFGSNHWAGYYQINLFLSPPWATGEEQSYLFTPQGSGSFPTPLSVLKQTNSILGDYLC